MERLEEEDDIARLEQADPLSRRGVRDPGIVAEALEVEKLAGTACTEADEPLERRQVSDFADLPQVSLDIGLKVVAERG